MHTNRMTINSQAFDFGAFMQHRCTSTLMVFFPRNRACDVVSCVEVKPSGWGDRAQGRSWAQPQPDGTGAHSGNSTRVCPAPGEENRTFEAPGVQISDCSLAVLVRGGKERRNRAEGAPVQKFALSMRDHRGPRKGWTAEAHGAQPQRHGLVWRVLPSGPLILSQESGSHTDPAVVCSSSQTVTASIQGDP